MIICMDRDHGFFASTERESGGAVEAVSAVATGPQQYRTKYPSHERSASQARSDIRIILDTWELSPLRESAELVVTELVANAVQHARGTVVKMSIVRLAKWVEISVYDPSASRPTLRTAAPCDEGGRGLLLVDALCAAWGVDYVRNDKRVWARLDL